MLPLLALIALASCPLHTEVLIAAADAIAPGYVDARSADRIAASVRSWAIEERYADACDQPAEFVRRVNQDLDAFDGHFHLEAGSDTQAGETDWLQSWRDGSLRANGGVREVRVLEGNVGYIRLTSFYPWDLARPKLVSALSLVEDADGLILDLRQNGGGDDTTTNQLLSALLATGLSAPASQQWVETRSGRRDDSLPEPELPRIRSSVSIIVLIDRRSGSASEALAYTLQAAGRAKIVGSRSGGAANMVGEPVTLAHGYKLAIPEARPINRVTGSNWEGGGVQPDVPGGDDPIYIARQLLAGSNND
ncbi:MAG: peptidase S41 [Alphaproteobacteria bacterium]|nr:MAG: peptidase S41 [Alphaproteobacteria bacterium]